MQGPALPPDELERLQALYRFDVLDTPTEEVFDRITRVASTLAQVPICLISMVDADRQWFKSKVGLDAAETPRRVSFCAHALLSDGPFIVPDALNDERFADNPLVTGGPSVRFYLGIPLEVPEGPRTGTLCVIDRKPRKLNEATQQRLHDLAMMVVREMELRKVATTDALTGAPTGACRCA
jgi:GAF domain-containing protein